MSLSKPIFIVGCPRSGTTLVQCILSASSQAFSLPETHFFSEVLPVLETVLKTSQLDVDALRRARHLCEQEAELPDLGALWTELEQRAPLSALELFEAIVEHFRPAQGLRAIEKTPLHVLHLDAIAQAYPDALFVNVVRDSVDVVSSLLNVPFSTSRSVLSHAQRWTQCVQAARDYAGRQRHRVRTVVYETLVREPETAVRELCAFLEVRYEAAMLEEFGREASRNVGRGETWKRDIQAGVLLNRQGVWKTRVSPGQAWLVAHATSPLRRDYGYSTSPASSAGSIVAAAIGEISVRFTEARRTTGVVGAARHAGSVLRALSAA